MKFYEDSLTSDNSLVMDHLIKQSIQNHASSRILESLLYLKCGYKDFELIRQSAFLCLEGKQWNKLVVIVKYTEQIGIDERTSDSVGKSEMMFRIMEYWPLPKFILVRVLFNLEAYKIRRQKHFEDDELTVRV